MAGYIEDRRKRRSRWQRFKDYWVDLWELQFPDKSAPALKKRKAKSSKSISETLSGIVDDAFSGSELKQVNAKRKVNKSLGKRVKEMLEDSMGKTDLTVNQPKKKFSFRGWIIRQIEFFSEDNEYDKQTRANAMTFGERTKEFFDSIRTLRFRLDLWRFEPAPFLNSAMMMVCCYLMVFFFHEYFTGLVATHYNLKPIILLYRIKYLNYYEPGIWNLWSVTRSYSAGPLYCLFSGAFVFLMYQMLGTAPKFLRLFLLWYSCIALVVFFSKIIFIPITSVSGLGTWEGLGIVAAWFYVGTFQKILLAFLAAGLLFFAGFAFTKPFMKMAANRQAIVSVDERGRLINQLAVGPLLLGGIIIYALNREFNIVPNTFTLSTGLFMLIVSYFNSHGNEGVQVQKAESKERFSIILLLLMVAEISAFIYIMNFGLRLEMHFM